MIARFPSLRLEGGLISSDQIDHIADQKTKEFSIDDIAAAWSDVRSYWSIFERSLAKLPADNLATSETRNKWMIPFFSTLGYELSTPKTAAEVDGQSYAISHRAGKDDDSTPIHIVGFRQDLGARPASGRPRLAPHSLLQEYLNRSEHLWGIVTNGKILRILRNSNLLRRQAYIEFDLEQIVKGEQFADFALLYRLIHVSRLPKGIDDASFCPLEQYHKQTLEQGGRVRDHLRDRVKEALEQFANGFLNHKNNTKLRGRVQDKSLEASEFYKQLLRLIYRLIFLMVSEERNLISDNMQYRDHYSISRIRRLAEIRAAYTQQEDLWLGLAITFKLFQDENLGPALSVPTLNGDLFDPIRTSEINDASLTNRDLLTAMWDICMYRERENFPWRRINYAALDVEELGSVYESLLEFQPVFIEQNGKTEFLLLTGTERKSTGSYYTPPELVHELIQSALVPVIMDRLAPTKTSVDKETALLAITVCDPACGSGHFLLAAARTIGRELAKARTGDEEPAPEQMRIAIRDSITHCIYGVDKNPLAVDLCKVALWLEGHTKSKPLTFLDHRIRCGDSLVGVFDLSVLKDGIPDDTFSVVTGDDKTVARDLKKQNKNEREHRCLTEFDIAMSVLTSSRQQVNAIADDKPADIRKKKELFCEIQKEGTPWCKDKTACDLWTAAFFVGYTKEQLQNQCIPTTETIRDYIAHGSGADLPQIKIARQLSNKYRFFHWALEFPEVFDLGGFDCVLGNPPWDIIKFNSEEFFLQSDIVLKDLTLKEKKHRIQELSQNPEIKGKLDIAVTLFERYIKYSRFSNEYQFQGTGDINSFKLFSERYFHLAKDSGYFGIILPSSIYTDKGCSDLRKLLLYKTKISSLYCFENRNKIFAIHPSFKFVIISTHKGKMTSEFYTGFMLHDFNQLRKIRDNGLKLNVSLIEKFSPDTLSIMEFDNKKEIDTTLKIFSELPLLGKNFDNTWNAVFQRELDHVSHHSLLQLNPTSIPVFEGKMIHHYYNKYDVPQYWLNENEAEKYYQNSNQDWRKYRLAYRAIASSTNETTLISTILPKNVATLRSLRVIQLVKISENTKNAFDLINPSEQLFLCGLMNSFILNFVIRRKVTTNISAFYIDQLPVPRLKGGNWFFDQIIPRVCRLICVDDDYANLWDNTFQKSWKNYSTVDGGTSQLSDWTTLSDIWNASCGVQGWNETKHDIGDRAQLRCELDALVAYLYGLDKLDLEYILSTFPGVKEKTPWLIEGVLREFERFQQYLPKGKI